MAFKSLLHQDLERSHDARRRTRQSPLMCLSVARGRKVDGRHVPAGWRQSLAAGLRGPLTKLDQRRTAVQHFVKQRSCAGT